MSGARLSPKATLITLTVLAAVAVTVSVIEIVAMGLAARSGPARMAGLETAAKLSPLNWSYRYELGALLARSGLAADAEPWFLESLALNPARSDVAIGLAEAKVRRCR